MFLFGKRKNSELEAICARIDTNVANNYKDAAQEALKELETRLKEIEITDVMRKDYESRLDSYKEKMKEFTHKDQKPYWT